jgi:hypothetical protein
VETLDWSHLEQVSEDLTSQLVIVAVKLGDLTLLDLIHQSLTTIVVNFVVL